MGSKIYLLSCLFLFIAFSCKKSEESAPDVSPDGEYFNCNIDGKYWTFKQGTGPFGSDALTASFEVVDRPHYEIEAATTDYPETVFSFWIDTAVMNRTDTVIFTATSKSYVQLYSPYGVQVGEVGSFESTSGKLIFTNRSAAYIQGIFDFEASNGTKVAKVTNGKFKIKL